MPPISRVGYLVSRHFFALVVIIVFAAGCLGPVETLLFGEDGTGDPAARRGESPSPPVPQAPPKKEKRVFMAQPPEVQGGLDSKAVSEAARRGIEAWQGYAGWTIIIVSEYREADLYAEYVKEWGGDRLGFAFDRGIIQIGLGDSRCNGKWTPFATSSLRDIAAHEMGHALGLDHSSNRSSIMYPVLSPRYASACEIYAGTKSVSAGSYLSFPFRLENATMVAYSFAERADGTINICLYRDGSEVGCSGVVSWKSDQARTAAADWEFRVSCENWFDRCSLEYYLGVGP